MLNTVFWSQYHNKGARAVLEPVKLCHFHLKILLPDLRRLTFLVAALKYLLFPLSRALKLALFPWWISLLFVLFTALRDLWSWRLRPLLRWLLLTLKDFRGRYVRASPLKHTCAQLLFFFFFPSSSNADGQMLFFLERGCPQKGPGLQTQRQRMSHAAGEI